MAPNKWDDESDEDSTPPTSPPPVARRKFDDEESEEEVLDDWAAAEDSEVEREKAKKAEEAKAKAEAEAKAQHKSKTQRIKEKQEENARRRAAEEDESDSDEDETEAERRARLRRTEKDSDLAHAEDLFGDLQVTNTRRTAKAITTADPDADGAVVDLSKLAIFNPTTKAQFADLRETLTPLLAANSKKAHYTLFMQEFAKAICKDLPSDQIKKIASGLTTLSNEKMKEEKLAEKGGKKTKAQKQKTTLTADRGIGSKTYADTHAYDGGDGMDDDDFM